MNLYSLQKSEFTPNLTFVYLGVFSTKDLAKAAAEKLHGYRLEWDEIEYDCRYAALTKKATDDSKAQYFTIEEDYLDETRRVL